MILTTPFILFFVFAPRNPYRIKGSCFYRCHIQPGFSFTVWEAMNVPLNSVQTQPSILLLLSSQGAVFLEGITVKGVTQVTIQPKLGEIQRMCQKMAEWDK